MLASTQEAQWDADWQFLMSRPEFRRVMFSILEDGKWCGVFASAPDGNGAIKDQWIGARQVGLQLMSAAQRIAPELYMRGLNEFLNDKKRWAAAIVVTTQEKPPNE